MAQRYTDKVALLRMKRGMCPECGQETQAHIPDERFWIPRQCSLRPEGVVERVVQYRRDLKEAS